MSLSNDRIQRLMLALILAGMVAATAAAPVRGQATLAATQERRPSEEEIGKVQVYLTPAQAVLEIFDDVASVDTVRAVLASGELDELHRKLGRAVPGNDVVVLKPRDAEGTLLGYAMIAEEVGKYRPITFMVGTDAGFVVRNVEVLVYRESRGGEVRKARFLRQYRGKVVGDPIRTNRDILNIAGATLSVTALNHGIKRVLTTLSVLAERGAL